MLTAIVKLVFHVLLGYLLALWLVNVWAALVGSPVRCDGGGKA